MPQGCKKSEDASQVSGSHVASLMAEYARQCLKDVIISEEASQVSGSQVASLMS